MPYRSKKFRELLLNQMSDVSSLVLGETVVGGMLHSRPKPASAEKKLIQTVFILVHLILLPRHSWLIKFQGLEIVERWHQQFGSSHLPLRAAFNYLKSMFHVYVHIV